MTGVHREGRTRDGGGTSHTIDHSNWTLKCYLFIYLLLLSGEVVLEFGIFYKPINLWPQCKSDPAITIDHGRARDMIIDQLVFFKHCLILCYFIF